MYQTSDVQSFHSLGQPDLHYHIDFGWLAQWSYFQFHIHNECVSHVNYVHNMYTSFVNTYASIQQINTLGKAI
jgi:hypothetical protein